MTARIWARAVLVVCALLLAGANAALAHEGHRKKLAEVPAEAASADASAPVQPALAPAAAPALAPAPAPAPVPEADDPPAAPAASSSKPAAELPASEGPMLLSWLGRFHPPLTHFPIALLIAAAAAELLFIRSGNVLFEHSVRFSVWSAALTALPAAVLGWFFGGFHLVDDEWVMTAHRWSGTGAALLALWILLLLERTGREPASRGLFRAALFSGAALVAAAGFFGGALLYGLDHYSPWVSK